MSPQDDLLRLIRILPSADVQNRLMKTTDRELALAMMYLSDTERSAVLSFLSRQKGDRVNSEYNLQKGLKITYNQYLDALKNVTARLEYGEERSSKKSYLRPVRRFKP